MRDAMKWRLLHPALIAVLCGLVFVTDAVLLSTVLYTTDPDEVCNCSLFAFGLFVFVLFAAWAVGIVASGISIAMGGRSRIVGLLCGAIFVVAALLVAVRDIVGV